MTGALADAIDSAARVLLDSSYVVALIGAGLSTESGIPTFRGPGGLWTRLGEPSMRGYQQFLEDPAAWWLGQVDEQADPARTEFREAIDRAEPNPGHYALAELEEMGLLKLTITQNVDNLHFRAGSKRVAEIHGNRTKLRCIGCESRWPRSDFPVEESPPTCPRCGGLVKSDTVMFGEPIPGGVLDVCFEETARCDCMIVAGTSATVYPAASFPETVKQRGGHLIEANPNQTPLTGLCDVVLRGPTGETLPRVVERVREMQRNDGR
ncbi:MAG: NAD-dependent deacylase [Chloroflexi bacterium]|nr:NAD-dependent deacylase [Chloroflexota bacterium]